MKRAGHPLCGLPTELSAPLEPFPRTLADIRDNLRGFIDGVTCTLTCRFRGLADFGDERFRFSAPPLDLHVAIQDNDSDIPIDRRPNPFHALHDAFRHIDFPESAIRFLGGDMATAVQQGQTENQPKRRA